VNPHGTEIAGNPNTSIAAVFAVAPLPPPSAIAGGGTRITGVTSKSTSKNTRSTSRR
jgi:hypothetical protein